MQRDDKIPEASDVNSFRWKTLIIFHKYAANLRSTKLRRGCGVNTNLCGIGRSTTKKLFFLRCKPLLQSWFQTRGRKKYATRVAESRGAAARIAVLADKYLYVHSRVDIARTRGVVCRRACLFRRRGKKGIHFSREKRGGISRVCFDAFVRDIIFLKAIPCDTDIIKRTTVNEICT